MALLVGEFEAGVLEVFSLPRLKLLHLLFSQMGFPVTHFTCEEREQKFAPKMNKERFVHYTIQYSTIVLYYEVDVYWQYVCTYPIAYKHWTV